MNEAFSTPDTFGVRIGGLPVSVLDDLRSPELWSQVERVLDTEHRLDTVGGGLGDTLYALIGHATAGKPLLVALRRAVHNRRRPAGRCWNDEVRALLPEAVAKSVRSWLTLLEDHRQQLERLDELLVHHAGSRTALLRKAASEPALQHGLVLGSPVLHERLRGWLGRPDASAPAGESGRAPDQKAALRLAKYLSRITMKTSPFSTFTISGLGRWRDTAGGESGTGAGVASADLTVLTVAEINVWVVQQVVRELSHRPEYARRLRLRLNPSAVLTGERWEFLGPGTEEPLRGLAASAPVRACVAAVTGTGRGTGAGRVREDAARVVAGATGSTPEAADAYLAKLVELGLLEAERPFPDQAMDPLAELRDWVAGVAGDTSGGGTPGGAEEPVSAGAVRAGPEGGAGSPDEADGLGAVQNDGEEPGPLLGVLDELRELVGRYAGLADPADRRECVRGVEAALRRLREAAGAERIELPAKNSVIENALLAAELPGPDRSAWAPVLAELDLVRRCYALLDPALPGRVALAEAYAEWFGPDVTVPFLTFHRAVQEWLRQDAGLPGLLSVPTHGYRALAGHRYPRLRELARLRGELCAEALEGRPDTDGVVRLDPARLAGLVRSWPEWMRAPDSVAFYGQPVGGAVGADGKGLGAGVGPGGGDGVGAAPGFVINAVNSGHGRGRDRIRRLLAQAGIAAEAATAPPPGGTVQVDTCRHYGSNVGLRLSAVGAELDYPEGPTLRPAGDRIRLGDLLVRHDPALGLLTLHAPGRGGEIRPVHPNLIAELWLPPAIRLLLGTFGATSNLLIPGRRMFGDPSVERMDRVLTEPRVAIGRTTVSRRQWVFPGDRVPVRRQGESDRSRLLRLAGWLRHHGMPSRCFVRGLDPASVVGGSVWRIKSRKPLYVDFANPLLVGVFERMLTGPGQVLFVQEALPGPDELPDYGDHGSRVTEYLIEINGPYGPGE
ncbi:lantibiotic dehydratase family protein [Streptomyces sp. LP05-1]|uniref:Lantibiotic dehydratase family protein n=1 Tax=Streptomyces pyxinae TaxID=2970734 RepID=A0ABT2CNE5_9ACTN|nr:lantibiotic dehydratase family protein [Streptomyces sp. LP05-1]MCS0638967.1 lantibiotic dehydratase family protein [Streptomyces sp. LP05-1]